MKVLAVLIAPLLLSGAAAAQTQGSAAVAAEPAVWQVHEIDFVYTGFTSTYSCDGLGEKLRALLLTAGAKADVKADPYGCKAFGKPDRFARVRLRFSALAPAPPAAAPTDTLPAQWRHIVIGYNQPYAIDSGDCELLEDFRSKVLTAFAVRNLHAAGGCTPHNPSSGAEQLSFETLTAAAAH
jgi:hypothetical protein